MTTSTHAKWLLACGLVFCAGTRTAHAGHAGAPAAPHAPVSVPHPAMAMPHSAIPAPRAPMAMQRAPIGAPRAPMASAPRPMAQQSRFGQSPHSVQRSEHADFRGVHDSAMSRGAEHKGFEPRGPVQRESHAGERNDFAHHGFEPHDKGRADTEHHELAHDDPARAHGRFDEHVRDPAREHDIVRLHEHDFHVRDVRYFNDREFHAWRGGFWHRDFYDGRFGWWFDVDGVYYPYAAPIFPYPLAVASLVADDVEAAPPPPPQAAGIPPLPALPNVAYHCGSPEGFYPEVDSCNGGWTAFAAH